MSGKYVRVDDVMELINTSNRGSCDYFIVDQIEELCRSEKIYDLDKVVEWLQDESCKYMDIWCKTKEKADFAKMEAFDEAEEIVKGGIV